MKISYYDKRAIKIKTLHWVQIKHKNENTKLVES